jgi:hypothetical protein
VLSPSSDFSPFSFCLSSAFGRSGGGGGTRRHQRARHGRKQLRLRPRPQLPGLGYQGCEENGLLPEDAVLSARAWRGALRRPSSCQPLRRTTRSSRRRNRPKPAPLAPWPRLLALVRARFMQRRPGDPRRQQGRVSEAKHGRGGGEGGKGRGGGGGRRRGRGRGRATTISLPFFCLTSLRACADAAQLLYILEKHLSSLG